ncbi:non-ribosomal peptide synthetase [Streptomyces sp. NL15-2K]|uniref:non-ribosomal peptide synthetase n=1 Tax=Streptomyces sp. NL15-2K TaxID=376149 RepID=UPI00263ADC18|nr:non-ribosomal peptide synthetase [Streptomyces sp. NL15-2K]
MAANDLRYFQCPPCGFRFPAVRGIIVTNYGAELGGKNAAADSFERHSMITPERSAILYQGAVTGYGELNRRAEAIAARLAAAGAGPSTLVTVVLPRDPDLVATLCAVLKLGAACLPADPGAPAGRQREILADAAPDVLVTTRAAAPEFTGDWPVCFLDDEPPTIPVVPPIHIARSVPGIAYILYTEPPDGRPGNSVVSYADLARYIDDPGIGIPVGAEILHLIAPLLSGNRLVLDADEVIHRPVTSVAPRDVVEEVVAQVWCAVLGVDRVGVRDRFFDLGGKSLLAVQVVARLRKLLGVELPLRALFDAPTVEELAAWVRAEHAGGQDGREEAALRPVERGGPLPLSFAQQRLWFLDQLVPDSAFYTMCDAFRIRGRLDLDALRRALRMLVARHETLRTAFVERDGVPYQVIDAADRPGARRAAALTRVDLTPLEPAEREESARRLVAAEAQTPFRLADGALMRVVVAQLADDEHVLVVTMHHIVSDAWSVGVLVDELGRLYRECVTGDPAGLPPLDVQYADFAVWQRDWMTGPVQEEQLAYWKRALDGAPSVLRLPTDHPRPAVQSGRGETVEFALPDAVVTALEELGREQGVTLFMTLLGAFQVLLARHAGHEDIVVGVPSAGRTRTETEPLVGFFVNTLPLRVTCAPGLSFRDLLEQVREAALGAFAHQDLPFETLVETLAPERDLSHNPLVQITFQLLNTPAARPDLPGAEVERYPVGEAVSQFDLSLDIKRADDGSYRGILNYCPDLFDRPRMDVLAAHYLTLLGGVAADPGHPIGDLPLSGEAERRLLLGEFGQRDAALAGPGGVPERFAEVVRAAPDARAVTCGEDTLTFAELDAQVASLARTLLALGITPETPVAVCLPRSTDSVVALLAVMRAGGVYVPLDPEWPADRTAYVLDDTAAPVVITRDLPAGPGRVHLDPRQPAADGSVTAPHIRPDQAAYIIYTSGSTGAPKGVAVQHRSLNHLTSTLQATFLGHDPYLAGADSVPPGDRKLRATLTAPFTFDASMEQLSWMLAGHELFIVPEDVRRDPSALVRFVKEHRIDVIDTTSSQLELLTSAGLLEGAWAPSMVMVGGEAVSPSLWQALRGQRRTRAFNLYGPTEATVDATCHDLSGPVDIPVIGTPLPDVRLRVLDERLRPVPVGVAGEIYLGGPGLARGYVNRPALTAQRFIADPYSDTPGSRLYRTGDRARRRPDGTLEYLGRTDDQIKLRGFRIEPGEIETVLTHHPTVKEAAVTVAADDGTARLIALVALGSRAPYGSSADGGQGAQVEDWNDVFETTHIDAADGELTFNIKGWNDSLTGAPIPAEHMREWVGTTVVRLLDGPAKRVLEIGCGTGLLMWRLLPHVAEYTGTDFSRPAVEWLREGLRRRPAHQARLHHREATDFTGVDAASTDLVVINSVVQYFPDRDYLDAVLDRAVDATADQGRVFVGDVRNLALAPQFYARQALAHADPGSSAQDVARAAGELAARDSELLISPEYFTALAARSPRVTGVEILPRRGRHRNEMSLYRYDVVLHVGDRPAAPEAEVITWGDQVHDLASLPARLDHRGPDALLVRGVANDRLTRDNELLEAPVRTTAVDPEDLWTLEDSTPYRVSVSWAAADPRGAMDVLLVRQGACDDRPLLVPHPAPGPSARLTNAPTRHRRTTEEGPAADGLRSWLAERLPAHLLPARIVEVDALPRTGTGKLDRGALGGLVTAGRAARQSDSAATAPRTGLEQTLANAWAQVLGLPEVGVHDNFFTLGGDSLLAIRAVARCRRAGVQLTVRQLLSEQTVAALAAALDEENHD